MPTKEKKHRSHKRFQIFLKFATILIICAIIVALFPKIESFNYTYQKGMPWKYETLSAPFDFPIHKTSDELKVEAEKISKEQTPVFTYNESTASTQMNRFTEKLNEFKTIHNTIAVHAIIQKLEGIYQTGIILLPEHLNAEELKTVLLMRNNIATEEEYTRLFTLKNAYSTLTDFVESLHLPNEISEGIKDMDLNNYLKPNLDFDKQKTQLAIDDAIRNISTTQGMVREGEVIVTSNELITPEKYKILESFKLEHDQLMGSATDKAKVIAAQAILTLIAIISFSMFLYFTRKRLFYSNKDFFFLYCMFLLTILMGSMTRFLNINILAIPVLFFPIIVNILFGNRAALYLLLGTTMLTAYFAPNSYMYIFMQLSAGIVAIFSLQQLQRRGQLFLAVTLVFLTYALVYGSFTLIQQGGFMLRDIFSFALLLINALLLSLTYPVLYLVERLFGYTSDISLLEYSNPNHPVLRNLTRKAPGTFQHSLMVANLAEEAIYHIGGSPLLARTGALYHDIGKIYDPVMFIENQSKGMNPHQNYDFDESAKIITDHVSKGIELAHKHKLPEVLTNFIRTHHGKSKVRYFYNSFKNKYPDREVDEDIFTYPGPEPSSKENAVLMMADAVEAASRSLEVKNEENIRNLVNAIIDSQLNEGRFNNADITFKNINTIKRVFTELLVNAYHARIAYPELKNNKKEKEPENPTEEHSEAGNEMSETTN